MDLNGKVAIVTGGTKGIGRGIAEALVRENVNVCISARSGNEIVETVRDLRALGKGSVTGIVCDVRIHAQIKSLLELTVLEFGGLDILVNNAGIGVFGTIEEMSPEDFRAVLETNLFGVFYCCHEAIPAVISSTFRHWPAPTRIRVWPPTTRRSLA